MIENQELRGQNSKKPRQTNNTSSNLENDKKCRDAIIWIGQSYPQILCNKIPPPDPQYSLYHEYCYLSVRGKKRRCYVHESELRGCCRKVPEILPWMEPGKSRIFLAHRGVYKKKRRRDYEGYRACGSLFGYFVLKRIEVITDPDVYENILQGQLPWVQELCEDIINAVIKRIKELELGTLKGEHRGMLEEKVCEEFEKKWKGKFIQRVTTGENVVFRSRTKHVWPENEEEITELDPLLEDLLEELIEELMEDLLNHEEEEKYVPVSKSVSEKETDRFCSKRLKVGGIYLVDALTAKITDEFMKKDAKKKRLGIAEGEKLFKETVNEIKKNYKRWEKTEIPSSLKGNAQIRGELILFKKVNKKYPIFEKSPRAHFRGLLRVDGEKLIEEIGNVYAERGKYIPKIPYCGKNGGKGGEWTTSRFASRFGLAKEFAKRVLQNYRATLKEELKMGDALVFSDIGEFTMTKKGLQFISYGRRC